jgi:hypothetical protein
MWVLNKFIISHLYKLYLFFIYDETLSSLSAQFDGVQCIGSHVETGSCMGLSFFISLPSLLFNIVLHKVLCDNLINAMETILYGGLGLP